MITTLQQQVNTMLLHQQGSRVEVIKSQVFGRKMKKVSMFINTACLYLRMKMTDEALKRAKGTISLAQARDVAPGPNCMLKSLWVSQTSFGHISTKSSTIPTVSKPA